MTARKLVYQCMVCAPALFLGALAVNARNLPRDFATVANDPCTEQKILAYAPYVRQASRFVNSPSRADSPAARPVARHWVEAAAKGELQPLRPVAFEDISSDGIKYQIFATEMQINNRLLADLRDDIHRGDFHAAESDACLGLKTARILKASDFISLFNCANQQVHILETLEPVLPSLSQEDRADLDRAVRECELPEKTIDEMVQRSRQLYLSWRDRERYRPLSIEDTQLLSDIPALIKDGNAVGLRQFRDRVIASKDDHLPTYCSSLRIGVSAENALHGRIDSILKAK